MARSRNIKHGLYLNEELAELSIHARYLFPCLWCLSDKNGRMEYRPRKIKAESYPYDDVDIPALLVELHEKQFISVYGNGTAAYIQINGWAKHQNPHPKEKASDLPGINDSESITATIEIIKGKGKQFNFVESNGPAVKFNLIPDSLPSDSNGSDSLPSDIKPCDSLSDHSMILNDGANYRPPVKLVDEWVRLFPAVDVGQQLRSMEAWCIANPRKRKTKSGIVKFINSWLSKEQDKGGGRSSTPRTFDQIRTENTKRVIDEWEP